MASLGFTLSRGAPLKQDGPRRSDLHPISLSFLLLATSLLHGRFPFSGFGRRCPVELRPVEWELSLPESQISDHAVLCPSGHIASLLPAP